MYAENAVLLRRIGEGDESAVNELISLNMGLVKNIAARFRDRGVEYEDLVQIGVIGMIKAMRSYNFSYNTAFSTYAVPLIIGEIRRFLRDDGPIKIGRGIKKQGINVMKQREVFMRDHGREPKISELAELCNATTEEIVVAMEAQSPIRSLSEPAGDDDGMTLGSIIAADENEVETITDKIALAEAIRSMSPLHRKIIALRYFRELSQQQTGELLGITQVKVSREEKKIMQYLRDAL
ncbi:MAG: sigma-70 family RNA polymerase sigma factor [Eubacteriales bacterium]